MSCPDDNLLVEYVEGLLTADIQLATDDHVDGCERCRQQLAWFAQGSSLDPSEEEPAVAAGSAIADRYTIVELIGTGGMSIVYAAYDRVLDRKVALKLLRDSDPDQTTRLAREAQAMARLAHPNVLPVYDVGTTAGRMFLTAELIDGQTLARWIEHEHDRSWRDVVELFVQAGRGLAAAHAAGIAHRDFKPSNVLLGADGRVRVADFGLAHRTIDVTHDDRATATALDSGWGDRWSTRTGDVVGTPAYMAPEQLAGDVAGPNSDQFAFCVSLFEALHGERPFEASSISGLRAAIQRGPRSGRRRVPARVHRVLDRGLAVEPSQRAGSMGEVVHELERALRRPTVAWVAVVSVVAVVAIAAVLAVQQRGDPCQATRQGMVGTWDDQIRRALRDTFTRSGLSSSDQVFERAAASLDEYARRWTAMRVEVCEATEIDHTQSPALLDLRMQCLDRRRAELAGLVGSWQSSPDREQIARATGAVLQLTGVEGCADVAALSARVAPPEDVGKRTMVTAVSERLATATGLERAGNYKGALAITKAINAAATGYPPLEADALYRRARLEGAVGDNQTAEHSMTEAVRRAAVARDDSLVAASWIGLVEIVGYRLARHDEGLALARTAEVAVLRAGDDPKLAADLHQQRGLILRDVSNFDAALVEQRKALELRRAAYPSGDPRIAQSIHDIAEIARMSGKLDQARVDHQQALDLRIRTLGPDHPLVAVSLTNLGHCYFALGQIEEARSRYEQALAIDTRGLPADHIEIGNALVSLAAVDLTAAKWGEAIARLNSARAIYAKALGDKHPVLAIVENNLGEAERGLEHLDAAVSHFERALAIRVASGSRVQPGVATALSNLADVLVLQHRYAEAKPRYEEALATFRKVLGDDSALTSNPLVGLARIALVANDPRTAIPLLERALVLRDRETPDQQAEVRDVLARALGRTTRGRALAAEAIARYREAGDDASAKAVEAWLAKP